MAEWSEWQWSEWQWSEWQPAWSSSEWATAQPVSVEEILCQWTTEQYRQYYASESQFCVSR